MAIEGSSGHMGYEQAQARAALPTIAQSTADTHSEAVTTNEYLKDVKSELNIQGRAIIQLAVSFRKFFEWNKEHATALMNSQALEDTATTGSKVDKDPKSKGESEKIKGLDLSGLSVLPTIMAVAIGTIGGLFIGITKTIKTWARVFVPGIVEAFDDFKIKIKTSIDDFAKGMRTAFQNSKSRITTSIDDFTKSIRTTFQNAKSSITTSIDDFAKSIKATFQNSRNRFVRNFTAMIDDLARFFGSQFARVKTFFSVADDGQLGKLITGINRRFKGFVDMLKDARDLFKLLWQTTIGKILAKIKSGGNIIKNLMFKFNRFGSIIGGVAKLVGKLFLPLTIVMTAFETIQGAIDGFNKDGWWGMIEGGITALFDSLIWMPLDLLVDGAAWLAKKLGWTDTAEILKNFSFSEIFNTVIGKLFDQVKKLVDSVVNIFKIAKDPDKTWTDVLFAGLEGIKNWYDLIFLPIGLLLKWLMGKFVWDEAEAEKKNDFSFTELLEDLVLKGTEWITEKITKIWEDIKTWLTNSFESILKMLPSMKELQSTLLSKLPSWMVPDRLKTDEMKAQEIKDEIAEQQGRIKRSLDGKNEYRGFEDNGREKSAEIIAELQAQLAEINVAQAAAPAIVTNNIDNSTINNQSSTGTAVSIQGGFGSTYTPNPLNS
jgi:hypothetical protein